MKTKNNKRQTTKDRVAAYDKSIEQAYKRLVALCNRQLWAAMGK